MKITSAVGIGCYSLLIVGSFFIFQCFWSKYDATLHAQPSSVDAMPYLQAGLTRRQAAAHLLERFTWGPRPEDVDAVVSSGLDEWFARQLRADAAEPEVAKRTAEYKTLVMSNSEIAKIYPPPGKVLIELIREGKLKNVGDIQDTSNKEARRQALRYAYDNGYRPQKELLGQMIAAKLVRAVYSNNQLSDVLSDFWLNHFSVSALKTPARNFIMSYERDAIRPNALGKFHDLLVASATHPAMLLYLDNAQSTAASGSPTLLSNHIDSLKNIGGIKGWFIRRKIASAEAGTEKMKTEMSEGVPEEFKPKRGINENYARELLELHTLGVDGGYTQQDVSELARVLSGWTMMPLGYGKNSEKINAMIDKTIKAGTIIRGDFLFRADAHDAAAKTLLGRTFMAGRGMDEGEEVLRLLSEHSSTAKRIATKLCVRFVRDNPSQNLIDQVAQTFLRTHGDVREMLRAIVYSPEFWSKDALRAKIKNPFELCISAIRATKADVHPTKEVYEWIKQMGQPLYAAPAPTGFSDKADAWVNASALLSRMNFGLALGANKIKGIEFDAVSLNNREEPESTQDALRHYFQLLLPERDATQTLILVQSSLNSNSHKDSSTLTHQNHDSDIMLDEDIISSEDMNEFFDAHGSSRKKRISPDELTSANETFARSQTLTQVVGLLLGSPEFQRR